MTTQSDLARAEDYATNEHYQRPWYWYDWANSAFVTTTATVLFGPYLTSIATEAACPGLAVLLVSAEPLSSPAVDLLRSRALAFSRKHDFGPAVLRKLRLRQESTVASGTQP